MSCSPALVLAMVSAKSHSIFWQQLMIVNSLKLETLSWVHDNCNGLKSNIPFVKLVKEKTYQDVKDTDWNKLSEKIDLPKIPMNSAVVAKILTVYYPNLFVPICARTIQNQILNFLKISRSKTAGRKILKWAKLLEYKESHPIMKNWSNHDYSVFLWNAIISRE